MGTAAITMIINSLASALPFLGKLFTKKKPDLWHQMTWDERKKYVREGLIAATSAILTGKALNIDDFMRVVIAKVDQSESYADWKRLNRYYITPMLQEASLELEQAKIMKEKGFSFSGSYFKYISPRAISQLEHAGTSKASLFAPALVLVVLSASALYFKKEKNTTVKFHHKQLKAA